MRVKTTTQYATKGNSPDERDAAPYGIQGLRQLQYNPGSEEPFHAHEQGQFISPLQGVAKVRTGQEVWVLFPGRGLWIPGDMPHGLEAVDKVVSWNIYFSPQASRGYPQVCKGLSVTPLMQALLVAGSDREMDTARQQLVFGLLSNEFQRLAPATLCHLTLPQERRLQKVCKALCSEPGHAATLAWWSTQVGASERTLARLFRKETELGFTEWRQQVRLLEAVCSLARGVAVNQLANELGYTSPSAFIAMFKKKLGASPQRYFQSAL